MEYRQFKIFGTQVMYVSQIMEELRKYSTVQYSKTLLKIE